MIKGVYPAGNREYGRLWIGQRVIALRSGAIGAGRTTEK